MFALTEHNIRAYDFMTRKCRAFCESRGFMEVNTQGRLDILSACENPFSIATFEFDGKKWPHRQTGQMILEEALLKNPHLPGVFCFTTSYRQERKEDRIKDRHALVFPMFEFELPGGMEKLRAFEIDLLAYLGFEVGQDSGQRPPSIRYAKAALALGTDEITAGAEADLGRIFGPVVFLEHFPLSTSPFWNMRIDADECARKIDVLIHGMETIGSAERSCNPRLMRDLFHTISDGAYARTLFEEFGKERVIAELEAFLALHFFPRSGGGIGLVPRLQRGLERSGLLPSQQLSEAA